MIPVCNRRAALVVVTMTATLLALPAKAATPRDELLRLVPDEAGFCLLIQGLREHSARLTASPFAARFAASPYGKAVRESAEMQKLIQFDEQLRTHLQVSWLQIRDDILGDAIVLAYCPGTTGKADDESGMLMLYARNPELLASLLDRLNTEQQKSGELVSVERMQHAGREYVVRTKKVGGKEVYAVHGSILIVSDKDGPIRSAIDRQLKSPIAEGPTLAKKLQSLGVEKDFLVWWVNPRSFDSAVSGKAANAAAPEATFLRMFATYWQAIDGAAISMSLGKDLALNIAVQARTDSLPKPAQRLVSDSSRQSALWSTFPEHALFAAAGKLPLGPLVETSSEFLPAESKREIQDTFERSVGAILGREMLPQLLKNIGPDWGVCVTAPEPGDRSWLPSLTAVLRLRSGGDGQPIEQRALDGLDFVARLAVIAYNSQKAGQLRMKMVGQEGVEVRVIEGDHLPPGLQPAFAWKGGFLVLASSPDAVRRFTPPTQAMEANVAENAEVPLLRLALQGWAGYLRTYRGPVAAFLAESKKIPKAEIDARIDRVLQGLELFDSVEVVQRTSANRATMTIRLKTLPRLEN